MFKHMPGAPARLYIRGSLSKNPTQKYLCVIGSRRCSQYGKDVVNKLFDELRGCPISIVSGLAIGIDSYAHEAALNAGLHCVAFPGSTLDWGAIAPPSRTDLAKHIVARGGAIVSAWPIGYEMGKWAFPVRNRYMAGFSHGTLIIEAAKGSGSLMTAEHALEYNRSVMAVPGSIFGSLSYGPHMLIKEHARMVTSARDILDELGFQTSELQVTRRQHLLASLDPRTRDVYNLISIGSMTTDTIVDELGMPVSEVLEKLSILELADLIRVGINGIHLL
jgi:DNA processing protein